MHSIETVTLSELIDAFVYFLKGCSFSAGTETHKEIADEVMERLAEDVESEDDDE
jgi:hypothetical protein